MKHASTIKIRRMILLVFTVFLFGYVGQAQTLGSLYNIQPQSDNQLFIEKGTELKSALEKVEKHYNVGLLYKSGIVADIEIQLGSNLSTNVEEALSFLLLNTSLKFKYLNPKTFGIYKNEEAIPEPVEEVVQYIITGAVIDAATEEALPGATILVDGTSSGTTTDLDGIFELEVESLNETLVVSFVGYQGVEIPIEGRQEIDIELQPMAIQGDDVVVTALGIDREARALGYSVANVDNEALTVNRTSKFADALQGKMAGVNVTPLGSGPQGSSKIQIRGQSSFGANNSPLIVVDGVPIDNTNFGVSGQVEERGSNRESDSGDGLSSINPDNIESMTVLKGAAAAALYGSRAKDGVIMIETKDRAEGTGVQVEYNSNVTLESPMDFRDYQFEYGQGEGGQRPTSSFPTSGVWSFGEKIEPGMTYTVFDGIEIPYEAQRNQLKDYYRNGSNMNNTISIASGGQNGGFNLSVSNLQSTAILPGSEYARNTISFGFTQTVADVLTVTGNVNYSNEERQNPPNINEQDYSPVTIYTLANTMPLSVLEENAFTEQGDEQIWSRFTNRTNPYFALSRFENNNRDRVYGNITTRFDITDWLYAQGRIGQDYYSRAQEYNLPTGSQRQGPAPPGFVNGQYVQDYMTVRELNADIIVNASKNIGYFGINGLVGGNHMYRNRERSNVLAQDFYTRGTYALSNARVLSPEFSLSERAVNSVYGSLELSYNALLFVTGTLRNDWFSTLSPAERSVMYPSITTSFIFTDALDTPEWLTYGQVRASYAEVGSDTDVSPYSASLFYSIEQQLFNDNPLGSISGGTLPNPNLRPMRVSEWEFGIETTLFDDVSVDFAYYHKTSTDQILSQQIALTSGYSSRRINVGEGVNEGVEMAVSFFPIRSDNFIWNANLNATYNTSEVVDLGEEIGIDQITSGSAEFHGELRQVQGMPMNQLYGYAYQTDDQGRTIYSENTGLPFRTDEQVRLGNAMPKWVGGITNSFTYRDVSFSFLVDFKLGHKMISGTHTNAYRHGLDPATLVGREQGYVVGDGVNEDGSVNTTQADVQTFYESIRSHRTSHQSVFNAGSWQLRQISLGYDFTELVAEPLGLRGLRLNIVSNNVAVLKKWVPHIHPDQGGVISDNETGLEATGLPVTRSIGFNLNVQF